MPNRQPQSSNVEPSSAAAPGRDAVVDLAQLRRADKTWVGGKSANLGELLAQGVKVPPGFAVTTEAYGQFVAEAGLESQINAVLETATDHNDPETCEKASIEIRRLIESAPVPESVAEAITQAYGRLASMADRTDPPVAVRSSAAAEDGADASFAGQQDSFLNVRGAQSVLEHVRSVWASLYTTRAIFYRAQQGHTEAPAMGVVVQRLIEARSSGVAFTLDPVTGDRDRVVIESTWGLGEALVGGTVQPDRFVVDRQGLRVLERHIASKDHGLQAGQHGSTEPLRIPPALRNEASLTDEEVRAVAKAAVQVEAGFGSPMDIEFAIDAEGDMPLWIVQARPETVHATSSSSKEPVSNETVLRGLSASPGIGAGVARVVQTSKEAAAHLRPGDILVTRMTNPDWVPYMKIAGAIVTDDGGVTCHAAIVSREMGTPCIVGARNATKLMRDGKEYTVNAKTGVVYAGIQVQATPAAAPTHSPLAAVPVTSTKVYVNLSLPEIAEKVARETPADGVGLLRAEHLMLGVGKHPRLLIEEGGGERMVEAFADGIARVAKPFHPRPVVYRFLDFKPDEFLELEGGERFERDAGHVGPNPLLGYRGAFRYVKEPDVFRLECQALRRAREKHGLPNVHAMVPFVRTVEEFEHAKRIMAEEGLVRGPDFKIWIMVEVPATVLLIDKFLDAGLDGVSFGTNDLTMLILGIDRDDASVQDIYDERNLAVLRALGHVIQACQARGVTTSVCGQAPSNHPEFVEFLVRQGATSLSVNVDRVFETKAMVASLERGIILGATRTMKQDGDGGETTLKPRWTA